MKKLTQVAAGLVLASSGMFAATASADTSFNIGWASEYHFRGVLQKNSSASAGVDIENGGFSVGAWTADVGDGLEVDLYGAYSFETESGLSFSVGGTGYYYTGAFDDRYEELNLSVGYSIFSLDYAIGEAGFSSNASDYDFLALTVDLSKGFYGTYGSWGDEAAGDYLEIGYGTTIGDLDIGVAAIFADDELGGLNGEFDSAGDPVSTEAFILTIGKSF